MDHELFDTLEDDEEIDFDSSTGRSLDDVIALAGQSESWTRSHGRITLNGSTWRPHLISTDGSIYAHIHIANRIRPPWTSRLRLASEQGIAVAIVVALPTLYEVEFLRFVCEINAHVALLDERGDSAVTEAVPLLDALAMWKVPVDAEIRTLAGQRSMEKLAEGSAYEKGKKFETLLAFLLSQVRDFEIRSRNYRGATDEIDIVLQVTKPTNRCWNLEGAPFILVEGRNRIKPVDKNAVSSFGMTLRTKRGSARIGLLVSATDITKDARDEELKSASTPYTMVLIDGECLRRWVDSSSPDDFLEEVVSGAMLR